MFRFETPWALLLLSCPVLLYLYRRWRRCRTGVAIRFSSLHAMRNCPKSWRIRLAFLPALCSLLAWIALTLALARPQSGRERLQDAAEGIAIEMVLDKSTSMTQAMDMGGRHLNRFESVKRVFTDFVFGNGSSLKGRPSDLIGMITFARYPDTICPLTLSHETLRPFIDSASIVTQRNEDGTAIGDALALAAARLKTAEETLALQQKKQSDSFHLASKVIILLTDGENNCGKRTLDEAGKLARQWGIKVYAIGVTGGSGPMSMFGISLGSPQLDTRELEKLAADTGGLFRLATDRESLTEIYSEIDKLERSKVEVARFVDYRELFVPFATAGFILLLMKILLHSTLFRTLP